ncbi:hypothetical protein DPMN_150597 [Dreissena polymorpha]|uniref:Uncharacterized protein n=1 Tax=Dreissena polymorpha TaxID=45954 RepID=A0A9D4FHZ7_DREPO|nr:hypothetical protein DPMN_150597 [Dreissena polymorpha]
MHIHEDVKPEDIYLAEHYLSLFENNCWVDSTIWSRMLFYIGRGEQHKQIHNFERSLDYFKEAKLCAENGSFAEHIEFITNKIQKVDERLCEKLSLEALKELSQTVKDILKKALDSTSELGSCAED